MSESTGHENLLNPVLSQIGSEIVSGTLCAGQRFTLKDICARFDISRTVAREIMRALEQMGMASSSRRVGLTVLPQRSWQVFDPLIIEWRLANEDTRQEQLHTLNEMRLAIEPIAARLAATHASDQQRQELVSLAKKLHKLEVEPSRRVGEELSVDLRFHSTILEASGNEMFMNLAPALLAMFQGRSVFGSPKRDPIAGTSDLHSELATAIAQGDAALAERLDREILDEARASLS